MRVRLRQAIAGIALAVTGTLMIVTWLGLFGAERLTLSGYLLALIVLIHTAITLFPEQPLPPVRPPSPNSQRQEMAVQLNAINGLVRFALFQENDGLTNRQIIRKITHLTGTLVILSQWAVNDAIDFLLQDEYIEIVDPNAKAEDRKYRLTLAGRLDIREATERKDS